MQISRQRVERPIDFKRKRSSVFELIEHQSDVWKLAKFARISTRTLVRPSSRASRSSQAGRHNQDALPIEKKCTKEEHTQMILSD